MRWMYLGLCMVLSGCPSSTPATTPGELDAGPDGDTRPCLPIRLDARPASDATWTVLSGPMTPVDFEDPSSPTSLVSFPSSGTYVLEWAGPDGADTVSIEVSFEVATSTDDGSDRSLRSLVAEAVACPGDDVIVLASEGPYVLSQAILMDMGQVEGDNDLWLDGGMGRTLTSESGVFDVLGGELVVDAVHIREVTATLDGGGLIEVRDGAGLHLQNLDLVDHQLNGALGGAIVTGEGSSTVRLTNVTAERNVSEAGGTVVFSSSPTFGLEVQDSVFRDHMTSGVGGVFQVAGTLQSTSNLYEGNQAERAGVMWVRDGVLDSVGDTFSSNQATELGGAVVVETSSSLAMATAQFQDPVFFSNQAAAGGAVFADAYSTTSITGGSFTSNTALDASGLASGGAIENRGRLTATSVMFSMNRAVGIVGDGLSSSGGAIDSGGLTNESEVHVVNCTFDANEAEDGAALYAVFDATVSVEQSVLTNNMASGFGGAVYLNPIGHGVFASSFLNDNTALLDGGAVYFQGSNRDSEANASNLFIMNTNLTGNEARRGGAIYSLVGDVVLSGTSSISTNTATQDPALPVGGGVCNDGGYVEGGDISSNAPDQVCDGGRRL